jgi:diaminohydroxyphosphoribosylaminopyrimidine deaminase / 5-amino-6-(5-phosphoribosylamino)uracil reductase
MIRRQAEKYMEYALGLAVKGAGRTHPNPMVGAVIVSSGKIIGEGYHRKAGLSHAEPVAIKNAKKDPKGAVMFVTLEPCDHYGRTPPCTEAIIKSGIRKVFVAMKDPNPINSGRGIRKLRRNGITVEVGLLSRKARELNRAYVKFVREGMPYVTIKLAQSADGKIAAGDGTSKWISSPLSRSYVKKLRAFSDGVMVGINTVLKDDPLLMPARRPLGSFYRIVLDSDLRISTGSRLIATAGLSPLILATTSSAPEKKIKSLSSKMGVEVLVLKNKNRQVDARELLRKLAGRGIISILCEGGGELAGSLVDKDLADEAIFFIAPKILGGERFSVAGKGASSMDRATILTDVHTFKSGIDVVMRGKISKNNG